MLQELPANFDVFMWAFHSPAEQEEQILSCILLSAGETREKGKGGIAILLAGNPQKCLLLAFKMSLHNNSKGKKNEKKQNCTSGAQAAQSQAH